MYFRGDEIDYGAVFGYQPQAAGEAAASEQDAEAAASEQDAEATEEATAGGGTETDGEAAEAAGDGEKASTEQTAAERRDNAARRRRQELEREKKAAVEAALAEQKKLDEQKWSDFFRRAKLTNTMTGEQINSFEEFGAWADAFETEQMQRELQEGKLTPDMLERMVANTPTAQRLAQMNEALQQRESDAAAEAAQQRIEAELREISLLEPAVKTLDDIGRLESAPQIWEMVARGYTLLDAFKLANMERLMRGAAEAAAQKTRNAGKSHMQSSAQRGAGAPSVPDDVKAIYRQFVPDASDAEIAAHYAKSRK